MIVLSLGKLFLWNSCYKLTSRFITSDCRHYGKYCPYGVKTLFFKWLTYSFPGIYPYLYLSVCIIWRNTWTFYVAHAPLDSLFLVWVFFWNKWKKIIQSIQSIQNKAKQNKTINAAFIEGGKVKKNSVPDVFHSLLL